jgi:hypothetical protein
MSTTHEILSHKRKRWPEWEWVASFVSVCLAFAADAPGVDIGRLGDLIEWRQRFLAARTGPRRRLDPAGSTRPGPSAQPVADAVPPLAPIGGRTELDHAARLTARPLRTPGGGARGPGASPASAAAERPGDWAEPAGPATAVRRGGPRVVRMMLGTRLHRLREERCITHTDAARAIRV